MLSVLISYEVSRPLLDGGKKIFQVPVEGKLVLQATVECGLILQKLLLDC